jgi:predicted dehydrogenase
MAQRRRLVQIGVGGRGAWWARLIAERYQASVDFQAICDNNRGRLERAAGELKQRGVAVRSYGAEDFERMLTETKAEEVLITVIDADHDDYACRAMRLGVDVVLEKPMATTADKIQRILDAQRETGRSCRVTFNYRYAPAATQIKDLLMSGVIGDLISVDFEWLLDIRHGADYFRRWHRYLDRSGGLMVHKATHHFDVVNWWLSSVPKSVFARGKRRFYTPQTAQRYGLTDRGERCLDCAAAAKCPFKLDMRASPGLKGLYLDQERHDGYFRDRCLFSDSIDIYDSMSVSTEYQNGVVLTYSLNAFMPWEGRVIAFNGTRGRLEHVEIEASHVIGHSETPGAIKPGGYTRICPHFAPAYDIPLWKGEGSHGGSDDLMLEEMFGAKAPDKYLRAADQRAGAWSALTGIAANRSIATGQAVVVSDLVRGLALPDMPPMPTASEPLPLPQAAAATR